jgi:outer membrane protein TolC
MLSVCTRAPAAALAFGVLGTIAATDAHALQPLAEFTAAAAKQNPDIQAAAARAEAGEANATAAWRKLWPTLTARASYTRNENESVATLPGANGTTREITMQAHDQLEGLLSLSIPLVDLSAWRATTAVDASEAATRARRADAARTVHRAVLRAWHQVVSSEAVLAAADNSAAAAQDALTQARARLDAGRASELEVHRATAELETAHEAQATAGQLVAVSRRSLASLSGLEPTAGAEALTVDLVEPPPLAAVMTGNTPPAVPAVAAARLDARQAKAEANAQSAAWWPTLGATLNERYTNAEGFSGENTAWSAVLALDWRIDGVSFARTRAAEATAAAQSAVLRRTEQAAADAVHDAWQAVRAQLARARAARAREAATEHAARLARERFAGGVATQLESIQADRDAFSAQVARIQAEAELAFARLDLDLARASDAESGGAEQ